MVMTTTHPPPLSEGEQVVWPWSQPFPIPEKEGVCMGMTTHPSLFQRCLRWSPDKRLVWLFAK